MATPLHELPADIMIGFMCQCHRQQAKRTLIRYNRTDDITGNPAIAAIVACHNGHGTLRITQHDRKHILLLRQLDPVLLKA